MSFWYRKPEEIDTDKVYDMMSSEYTAEMGQRSKDMIDPNSQLMQSYYKNMKQDSADSLALQNQLANRNAAASGDTQSGAQLARQEQRTLDTSAQTRDQYTKMVMQNLGQSNSMLQAAGQNDMMARDAQASAYGQNITNMNNFKASQDAFYTQMIGTGIQAWGTAAAASDKRLKKDMKKIGKAKTKDGKKVNIYSFKYKGDDKKRTGVIAQEIEKSHPQFVKKDKKGMRAVDYKGLFG